MKLKQIHYAWIIVFSGMLTLFCCMGLGRFALGMLLPSMGESLQISYSQMGFISTGNFVGYLISVVLCGQMIARLGEKKTIIAGLILISASMVIVSLSHNLWLIIAMYFLTGIGSGAANITAMTLVAHWFTKKYRGRAAGYMIIGNGLGITASGLLIPWLNSQWIDIGWRIGWASFAIIIAILTVITAILIKNNPKDLSIAPYGKSGESQTKNSDELSLESRNAPLRLISHIGIIYFAFGFTYVIYTTFIVTTLVEHYGFSEARAGAMWMMIGVISAFSGALFGWVSDHFGRKTGLVSVYGIQTVAYLLVALELGTFPLLLSMMLFAITAFSIPAIIAATVSDLLPPSEAAKVFGYVTFFFSVGQILGPTLAGYLAEYSGTFSSSYLLASGLTLVGIVLTLLLKTPARNPAF